MITHYKSAHIQNIYGVSYETVRNYCKEFARYLSPTARPGSGKHRNFTHEDLRVFALIVHMKREEGQSHEAIHAALKSGQRGEPPSFTEEEIKAIALSREGFDIVEQQKERIQQLEIQLLKKEQELSPVSEENIALKAEIRLLREQLELAQSALKELARETQDAFERGLMRGIDATRKDGDTKKTD